MYKISETLGNKKRLCGLNKTMTNPKSIYKYKGEYKRHGSCEYY